jgi:lysyl-tRNA synthetase class 2
VDTPSLQFSPGNEVHLQAFQTTLKDPHGNEDKTLYLHTSPEFAMKKLLVAGEPKIFQIAHVFRNGERSSRHHPEFSMMEWYRANADTEDLKKDCLAVTRAAANAAEKKIFAANGMTCDPFSEWISISVPEAFKRYADIDILATAHNPLAPDAGLLRKAMDHLDVRKTDEDSWDDLFFRIMGDKIEPFLGKDNPTFLCDYPLSMAALARPKPEDPRLAERFELYMAGYEIANAFGELTDAGEQLRRFESDMDLKEKLHGERYPIDMDFIEALRHGMPPSAGIALGIDRLVMLCAGTETIDDVLWLPVAG